MTTAQMKQLLAKYDLPGALPLRFDPDTFVLASERQGTLSVRVAVVDMIELYTDDLRDTATLYDHGCGEWILPKAHAVEAFKRYVKLHQWLDSLDPEAVTE